MVTLLLAAELVLRLKMGGIKFRIRAAMAMGGQHVEVTMALEKLKNLLTGS